MKISPPEPDWITRAVDGDAHAWSMLLDHMLPAILGWCRRLGGPSVVADDAAQDVCLVVMQRLHTLRDPVAFPAWVFGITRRVLDKHRRRARWKSWLPLTALVGWGTAPETDDLGGAGLEVLDALPPKQREVLVLCAIEERTCQEAAEILDVPAGTVKSRLRLARARFVREARVRGMLDVLEAHVPGAS
jgi:RNA polymerase sigma-70 factor (ECF subfamily)